MFYSSLAHSHVHFSLCNSYSFSLQIFLFISSLCTTFFYFFLITFLTAAIEEEYINGILNEKNQQQILKIFFIFFTHSHMLHLSFWPNWSLQKKDQKNYCVFDRRIRILFNTQHTQHFLFFIDNDCFVVKKFTLSRRLLISIHVGYKRNIMKTRLTKH